MDFKDFELIYKNNRHEIQDKHKIKSKLSEILGDPNVSDSKIDLFAYTKDSTMIGFNWILEGKIAGLADFITWPENKDQIREILELANLEGIPIIPYAEGSGVVGGAIPIGAES